MKPLRYGSLKNKNDEYIWWYVLWRLPNYLFEARGYFDDGDRDGRARHVAQWRAVIGVGALIGLVIAYPGYVHGIPELFQTTRPLWPGAGSLLRLANSWQTSIVYTMLLAAGWIILFAVLIISVTRREAIPGLLLRLRWPTVTMLLFTGVFLLFAIPLEWWSNQPENEDPSFAISIAILIFYPVVITLLLKSTYVVITDVFRGDDTHPLLAPFVSTGVSWTLAYLALSSGGEPQTGVPDLVRWGATLLGPVTVTGLNVWVCRRIRRSHGGNLLFRDGAPGSRGGRLASRTSGGLPRREVLKLALPSVILLGASPWWAPKALALVGSQSDQVESMLSGAPSNALSTGDLIMSVTFSPDGRTLAFGTTGGLVELWGVADPAHPVAPHGPGYGQIGVSWVAFSPDGHTLASGSGDTTIYLWDVTDPAKPVALGDPLQTLHQVSTLAFSPDGRLLAVGCNDGYQNWGDGAGIIQLWNVADPAEPVALGVCGASVHGYSSVAFSPDGCALASGNLSSVVQLWDVANPAHPTVLASVTTSTSIGYTFVAFGLGGRILAGGNGDGAISLWNLADPGRLTALGRPLTIAGQVSSLAISRDGQVLAAASGYNGIGPSVSTGAIQLWDISESASPSGPNRFAVPSGPGYSSVAFSPDGRTLASAQGGGGGYDENTTGSVQLWDVADPTHPTAVGLPFR
jgi:WD40 repeat protein